MTEPEARPPGGPIPRYARVDVIGGAVMVGISALIWFGAIGLDIGHIINFGAGAMPRGLAILLLATGAGVLIHGLVQEDAAAERLSPALRPPVLLALAICLFGVFIRGGDFRLFSTPQLGLTVIGPLTVIVAGLATPEAQIRELLVLAFGLTAATMVVFADLLGVPLPIFPKLLQSAIPPEFGVDAALRVAYAAYALIAGLLYLTMFGLPGRHRD